MNRLLLGAIGIILTAGLATGASAADPTTLIPDGMESAPPDDGVRDVECDLEIRYDDNEDDSQGSGSTLGGPAAPYWYLGVRYTPPADQGYLVQSAGFWSEFWVTNGNVTFRCYEISNPANETFETVFVNAAGTWEIDFTDPICVGAGSDYGIVLCPDPGVWGVTGEDTDPPYDARSYQNNTDVGDCELINVTGSDLLIWSCVTPCGGTPVEEGTWGTIKSHYR